MGKEEKQTKNNQKSITIDDRIGSYHKCLLRNDVWDKISELTKNIMEDWMMNEKITITVYGDAELENHKEHKTIIENQKGKKKEYYFDGWNGISYHTITEFLDFVGIEYFTVHKN